MGDMKSSTGKNAFTAGQTDDDPFAELARLIDEPWLKSHLQAGAFGVDQERARAAARNVPQQGRKPSEAHSPSLDDESWAGRNSFEAEYHPQQYDPAPYGAHYEQARPTVSLQAAPSAGKAAPAAAEAPHDGLLAGMEDELAEALLGAFGSDEPGAAVTAQAASPAMDAGRSPSSSAGRPQSAAPSSSLPAREAERPRDKPYTPNPNAAFGYGSRAVRKPAVQPTPPTDVGAPVAETPARRPIASPGGQLAAKPTSVQPQSPQAAAAPARRDVPEDRQPAMPMSLEDELELALQGLSAPADPRDPMILGPGAFAPARKVEPEAADPQPLDFDEFDELIASELAVIREHPDLARISTAPEVASLATDAAAVPAEVRYTPGTSYREEWAAPANYAAAPASATAYPADEDDFSYDHQPPPSARRRPYAIIGGVAALALVGVAGAALWSGNGANLGIRGEGPILIKADTKPVKIQPENPGGRTIPNQNQAVYKHVSSPDAPVPLKQQTLVTAEEEPISLPPEEEDDSANALPGVSMMDAAALPQKDATRLADASAGNTASDDAGLVLKPRKVHTLVVRADGTLGPAETNAGPSAQPAATGVRGGQTVMTPTSAEASGIRNVSINSGAQQQPQAAAAGADGPAASSEKPDASGQGADTASTPALAAAAPDAEPAAKPADAPREVASVSPAAPTPAPAGFYVQIASQPSQALAQESAQRMGQRYASVIGSHKLEIQTAEIAGKGTYYRVRIPAQSASEASELCSRLKSAGGSCFVAR